MFRWIFVSAGIRPSPCQASPTEFLRMVFAMVRVCVCSSVCVLGTHQARTHSQASSCAREISHYTHIHTPGLVEFLLARMPEFFVASRTGHKLETLSALYEYLGASLVLTMPSAVALAGWPAFEWGRTGVGPSFPQLSSLIRLGVNLPQLEIVINALYNLHDESPPMYLEGGALRSTLHTSLATQLMYYEERWQAVEMKVVQVIPGMFVQPHTQHPHMYLSSVSL